MRSLRARRDKLAGLIGRAGGAVAKGVDAVFAFDLKGAVNFELVDAVGRHAQAGEKGRGANAGCPDLEAGGDFLTVAQDQAVGLDLFDRRAGVQVHTQVTQDFRDRATNALGQGRQQPMSPFDLLSGALHGGLHGGGMQMQMHGGMGGGMMGGGMLQPSVRVFRIGGDGDDEAEGGGSPMAAPFFPRLSGSAPTMIVRRMVLPVDNEEGDGDAAGEDKDDGKPKELNYKVFAWINIGALIDNLGSMGMNLLMYPVMVWYGAAQHNAAQHTQHSSRQDNPASTQD